MAYDKNLQAFKDAALSQGYQQSEIDAFTEMAIEGQKNKKIREQETTRSELDLYRQKKIIDQDFKTDAASTPGSLTEMESRGITEGVAELKYDEASGSYKVIPKNKETGISVKDLSEQDTKMFNALTAAQAAVGILDEGLDTGPLGNIISGVESLTGKTTKYSDYKSKLALSTSALKSYLIGGAQTDPELRGLADALPKKTDQEAIAKQKLNNFINLYGKKFGLTSVVDTKNVAPGVGLNKPEDLIAKNNNEVQTPDDFVKKPRSGLSEWLYGDRESKIGKGLSAVGNILSPVSFTAGGIIKSGREMNEGTYKAPETGVKIPNIKGGSFDAGELILPQLVGAYRGLTQKQPLMTEVPEYLGINPDSALGLGVGFGAELLTPDVADFAAGAKIASKVGKKVSSKLASPLEKITDYLSLKAIRPSKTQITKFGDATGEDLGDFVLKRGLQGKDREALQETIKPLQNSFDEIINSSGRKVEADTLLGRFVQKIDELKNSTQTEMQKQGAELEQYAINLFNTLKKGSKDFDLPTLTSERKLADKLSRSLKQTNPIKADKQEMIRQILQDSIRDATEDLVIDGKNIKSMGQELSKLYELDKIMKTQQNLGRGNLPIGLLTTMGAGAGAGSFTGDTFLEKVKGAAIGAGIGAFANNPKVIQAITNIASKNAESLKGGKGEKLIIAIIAALKKAALVGARTKDETGDFNQDFVNSNQGITSPDQLIKP